MRNHRLQFDVILVIFTLVINLISTSDRVFDAQPKIITQDGHLIFMTADNHNITFKSLGQGSIRIDEDDLKAIAESAKRNIAEMERIKNDDIATMQQTIRRLETRLDSVHSAETRLSSVEEAVRQFQQQLSGGSNGTRLADLASNQIQTSRQLQRLRNEFREVKQLLEKDECDSNPCRNGGTCVDSYNGYTCKCLPNWEGSTCDTDVNECREFSGTGNGCQNGATCINTHGDYSCQCPPNWYGVHCTETHDDCTAASTQELCGHGTCINQARIQPGLPKYTCICDQGWKTDGHNPACNVDIDECATGRHSCSQNPYVQCINIPGSFVCGLCPVGYSGNGFVCDDINECLVHNGGCSMSPMVRCVNTPGSRQCEACPSGYQGDGVTCIFSGLCIVNNGGCHPLATCIENSGISSTYRECRCPPGFTGTGFGLNGCVSQSGGGGGSITPVPFSPCDTNPCLRGTCVAVGPYAFRCNCPLGFEGQRCELDSDNCANNPCLNGGTCIDMSDGFVCHCSPHKTGVNCEEDIDACGAYLYDVNGTIRYPSNPSIVYQNDKSCAWVITTTPGMVLNLTFSEFHLETSSDCEYDFLQLNDGNSAGSHLIGRFCGTNKPNGGNVITTHNAVYIWFHSDSSIPSDGFRIDWTTIEHVCGGDLLESTHGIVKSPGYPGGYPMNSECSWTIRVPLGKRIMISFATLMLEHHDDCGYDYLEIRDGLRDTDQVLVKLCGVETHPPEPIQTSGPFARLYFHSDSSRTASGFHLTYLSVPSVHGCGGLLTSESGTFTSPDHPNSYDHGLECDWQIRVPPHEKIRLTFTTFDIEAHDQCRYDNVEIYDGSDATAPLIGRYCGRNLPQERLSEGNNLFIRFTSDYSIGRSGFRASYLVVCGGTFTEPQGIIHSPYYPEPYPADRECIYLIRQPAGKAIDLQFVAFDIESTSTCRFDYVLVRDGDSETSPVQGTYCGTNIPSPIISTFNALWIQFVTDDSVHNRGFMANYTTIDVVCGGILTDMSGIITSPNHPDEYLHGASCSWIIRPPEGHVVKLTFISFAVENHVNCDFDYVAIYDNTTTEDAHKLTRRFCGNTLPPDITSSDNLMLVVFHSDHSVSQDGFSIHYLVFDASSLCGGNFYSMVGVIRSPNFPDGYPHNRRCTWKIEVQAGQQIMLNVTRFELESHTDCNYDYLEIRNGGSMSSPEIGKFCGTTISRMIPSHGNQMWLQFVTDSSQSAPGFEITWDGTTTGCGGEMTASQGSIASPFYPDACNTDLDCTWSITVARGNKIKLHFADLSLPSSDDCLHYGVEFYNGKSIRSPLMRRVCGSTIPNPFVSEKHEMFLRYRCNEWSASGHRGFRLNYETMCDVNLSGRRGVIETPNFPNPYPHNRNCTWNINGLRGNKLNMSFATLQLEEASDCRYDFITVYDNANRSTLGPYCSSEQVPRKLSLKGNEASVNFVADSSYADSGFSLEWVSSGCGGDLRKPSASFSTPNYPNLYPNSITCEWEIIADPGNSIELTIHNYDIESSRNCMYDSIKIYGGIGTSAPLLSSICHRQTSPSLVTSSGNHLYVRFISDVNKAYKGFNASYVFKPDTCGGISTVESGTIHSRNYPEHYLANDDCSWLLTVHKGHTIVLTFTDFQIARVDENCSAAHVAVYDGPDEFSPMLLRHCDFHLPSPTSVNSSNNQMFVKMRVDGSVSAKGFKAEYRSSCGADLFADEPGIIDVGGFPYSGSRICSWIIRARNLGDKVTLLFTFLDVPNTPLNCSRRSLIDVYDGDQSDSPLLLRLCEAHVPPAITSHGSALRVIYNHYYGNVHFTANYYESMAGCGGVYDSLSGTFVSPDYPNFYPFQMECVWTIKSAPGHLTMISFSVFDLEESDYCNIDYVEIRENDESGRLMGRYCGQTLPTNLTAAHQLWVKFRSDNQNAQQGFVASYNLLYGSNPTGMSGEIANPLYPRSFRGRKTFQWIITVPLQMFVQVTVIEMEVSQHVNGDRCLAALSFYDGADNTAELLGTHCGYQIPNPIVSHGNQMLVKFSSTIPYSIRGNKFFLKWEAILHRPIKPVDPMPTENKTSECSGVISINHHETYTLQSPGFPNGYSENLNCEWSIVTPIGTKPKLSFSSLNLESFYHCYGDYIQIYGGTDIDGEWEDLGRFCQRQDEHHVSVSGSNTMRVQFLSDSFSNKTGFSAQIAPVCGGNMTALSGSIQTPNYPSNYDFRSQCDWLISVRPGRTIELRFEDFQLEGEMPSCINDYVLIRNGMFNESPLLGAGKFCGSSMQTLPDTTSNHLLVRFVSNPSFTFKGFKLIYNEISQECGGMRMLSDSMTSVQIETPNFPNSYPIKIECEWIIIAPSLNRVRLDFVNPFDIPFEQDCFNDYLVIHDGGTEHAPILNRFCGHDLPSTVQASGNKLFVRFSSKDNHPSTGFKATATMAACGGTISANSGFISSPEYPHGYSNGLNCEWIVRCAPGHFLIFKIVDLQTVIDSDDFYQPIMSCNASDSLIFRDFNSTGNVLGEFCGEEIPPPITSAGNVAYVRFTSKRSSRTVRGFRLNFNISTEECGGLLTTETGVITSPNYPGFYPSHRQCIWEIIGQQDRRIRLTFTHMDIQGSLKVQCYDFVVAFNYAISDSHYAILPPYHICGSNDVNLTVVTSSSNYMKVMFITDKEISGTGFRAVYDTDLESECGGDLDQPSGFVTSPGFGTGNYSHNLDCRWFLVGNRPNTTFLINIYKLEIENPSYTTYRDRFCTYDRLDIFPDSDFMVEVPFISLCGNITEPMIIAIPFSAVLLHFRTDSSIVYAGFNLSYSVNDCGGEMNEAGVISSPGFPSNYRDNVHCTWAVRFEEGQQVQITFEDFQLEQSNDCSADKVIVHNSMSNLSPIIGTYCGGVKPEPIRSQHHEIYIEFISNSVSNDRGFRLNVEPVSSGCGGVFHAANGVIKSVNYPNNYPANVECQWLLEGNTGFFYNITFVGRFDLEMSASCDKDFVEGFEHVDGHWLSLGRRCGRDAQSFMTKSPKIRILFRTNDAIDGGGFKAIWKESCGGLFTEKIGSFSSPGYPNFYPNGVDCIYVISPDPNHYVVLEFSEDFDLEESVDCTYDVLDIYAGNTTGGRKLNSLCGKLSPSVISNLGAITLRLFSDFSVHGKGFEVYYHVSACGGFFNYSSESNVVGQIRSPTQPHTYHSNMNCTWIVEAHPDRVISFKFQEMSIENHYNCWLDYVALFDGGNTLSPQLGRFCGDSIPMPILTTGNKLTVQFKTDYNVELDGFSGVYRETYGPNQGCGGILNTPSGNAQSLDFDSDGHYEPDLLCTWTIIGAPFKVLKLTFLRLDIETSEPLNECLYDYLEIRDGPSSDSNLIEKLCGTEIPQPILASSNQLWLSFSSDSSVEKLGFQLTYTSVDPECGGFINVTDATNYIQSPGYPENYQLNVRCRWSFISSSLTETSIEFNFEDFQLEDSDRCTKDYLSLHDNIQSRYVETEINTYCGHARPSNVHLDASEGARIDFVSDSSTRDKGFKMSYRLTSCNRTYNNPYGMISHHGNGLRTSYSLQAINCYIRISVPENHTITLTLNDISLSQIIGEENNCNSYMEIKDGYEDGATPLAKFCEYISSPNQVSSTGHEMMIRLNVASNAQLSNLKALYFSTDQGPGCGGDIVSPFGSFASPHFPGNYSRDAVCRWKVTTPSNKQVNLFFETFDINHSGNCSDGSVEIYDGHIESDNHLISTFCGSDHPGYLRPESNKFIVKYMTSVRNSGTGFSVLFTSANNHGSFGRRPSWRMMAEDV